VPQAELLMRSKRAKRESWGEHAAEQSRSGLVLLCLA
jgi:hypothetical protein